MKKTALLSVLLSIGACDVPNAASGEADSPLADIVSGQKTYDALCASCHGSGPDGGLAPSLFDNVWVHGAADEDVLKTIKDGLPEAGMPGFGDTLSDADRAALLAYIKTGDAGGVVPSVVDVPSAEQHVVVKDWVTGLDQPWGLVFTGPDDVIVTEKGGALRRIRGGVLHSEPVKGTPDVFASGQGGLLDVALDPDYNLNKWIYIAFSDPDASGSAMTKIVRGRIRNNNWNDEQVLFEAKPEHYISARQHFGSRITFDNQGHMFFSIGDRGRKEHAQDIARPNGKIHRINRDGSIPADNPFVDFKEAYSSIYAYGNRNPQGLIVHPYTKVLWETEHGPKGGDELNVIKSGVNYGWPEISYGRNYNGTELTPYTSKPGMAQPISHWTPSIAVCGLDVYDGELFPDWKGKLLVGSLANQTLRLVTVKGNQYVSEVTLLKGAGRVRDVTTGPDGAIYVALPNKIVRLTPRKTNDD